MMHVNGEEINQGIGLTIQEYLLQAGYHPEIVVVEKNLEIIPKEKYGETMLCDGDTVEILTFMGGG